MQHTIIAPIPGGLITIEQTPRDIDAELLTVPERAALHARRLREAAESIERLGRQVEHLAPSMEAAALIRSELRDFRAQALAAVDGMIAEALQSRDGATTRLERDCFQAEADRLLRLRSGLVAPSAAAAA